MLDDDEIRTLSATIAGLGTVSSERVERVIHEYVQLSTAVNVHGHHERARQLLEAILPDNRLGHILEEIGSPLGKTIWQRLASVRDDVLGTHLRFECPQTIAVVLTRLKPQQAARVLGTFDDEVAVQVVERMLVTEDISKPALEDLEEEKKRAAKEARDRAERNEELVRAGRRPGGPIQQASASPAERIPAKPPQPKGPQPRAPRSDQPQPPHQPLPSEPLRGTPKDDPPLPSKQ
jgi:flagellar motor switch protein FliG